MRTPFGKQIRKLRIDKDVTLKEMANKMKISSAYLSSIELGKRRITKKILRDVINYFDLSEQEKVSVQNFSDMSQPYIKISLLERSDEQRSLAVLFARKFKNLSNNQCCRIRNILGRINTPKY